MLSALSLGSAFDDGSLPAADVEKYTFHRRVRPPVIDQPTLWKLAVFLLQMKAKIELRAIHNRHQSTGATVKSALMSAAFLKARSQPTCRCNTA
jgi:hypothetical protein